jgi:hypothetical protein
VFSESGVANARTAQKAIAAPHSAAIATDLIAHRTVTGFPTDRSIAHLKNIQYLSTKSRRGINGSQPDLDDDGTSLWFRARFISLSPG